MNEKPVIPVRNKPNVSPNPSLPAVSTADHNLHRAMCKKLELEVSTNHYSDAGR